MQGLLKEGITYREYFQGVKKLYDQVGYPDEWQRHHQGGPTGYACRELIIAPAAPGTIETDFVFAWNPTIQGTKCEETTCLRKSGVEIFTDTGNWHRKRTETPYGSFETALVKELN